MLARALHPDKLWYAQESRVHLIELTVMPSFIVHGTATSNSKVVSGEGEAVISKTNLTLSISSAE